MAHERGILLEIKGHRAIVLTPGGEFRRVPAKRSWEVGQEVSFETGRRFSWSWNPAWAGVAVAAVFLLVAVTALLPAADQPVAYVTVDINPSLELAIDGRERVIEATSLNSDGDKILTGLTYEGRQVDEVVADITRLALEQGFIKDGSSEAAVVITVVPAKPDKPVPAKVATKVERAKTAAQEVLQKNNLGAQVQTLVVDNSALREEAQSAGLSPGKYAVWLEAQKEGLQISLDDLKEKGIAQALKDVGVKPGEIIGKAKEEKDFREVLKVIGEKQKKEKNDEPGDDQSVQDGDSADGQPGGDKQGADNERADDMKPDDNKSDDKKPDDKKADDKKPDGKKSGDQKSGGGKDDNDRSGNGNGSDGRDGDDRDEKETGKGSDQDQGKDQGKDQDKDQDRIKDNRDSGQGRDKGKQDDEGRGSPTPGNDGGNGSNSSSNNSSPGDNRQGNGAEKVDSDHRGGKAEGKPSGESGDSRKDGNGDRDKVQDSDRDGSGKGDSGKSSNDDSPSLRMGAN